MPKNKLRKIKIKNNIVHEFFYICNFLIKKTITKIIKYFFVSKF